MDRWNLDGRRSTIRRVEVYPTSTVEICPKHCGLVSQRRRGRRTAIFEAEPLADEIRPLKSRLKPLLDRLLYLVKQPRDSRWRVRDSAS